MHSGLKTIPRSKLGFLSPEVISFLKRILPLLSGGSPVYVVGGFVRDALIGRQTRDLDLAVSCDPIALGRVLAGALDGAFVLLDDSRQISRVIVGEAGEKWQIDLTPIEGDIESNLGRRDFTIDAMGVSIDDLLTQNWSDNVVDRFGGRIDLEYGIVRAVTPGIFVEDGLRLLRGVRLAALLQFSIDPDTYNTIRQKASEIGRISGERVRDEFMAILGTHDAVRYLYLLDDLDLLCRIVPELEYGRGITQPKEHYWDIFRHNVETVGAIEGLLQRRWTPSWVLDYVAWDEDIERYFGQVVSGSYTRGTLLKLASLVHDVAKPTTRTIDTDGRIRFLGHHTEGALMASGMLRRFGMSKKSIQIVETEVRHHLRPGQMSHGDELATPRAVYRYFRSVGDVAKDTLYLNLADYLAARGPLLQQDEWKGYASKIRHILDAGLAQPQKFQTPQLLDGHAIMSELRIRPGRLVGRMLETVREAHATSQVTTRHEAISMIRELFATEITEESYA